ncbi:hypothetical protein [Actinomadura alba]|uniref:Uncharacterized protein n=1 Tax=Actinomadura alba TaxID=406431 RepID=A0ABR7LWD2_9ACTN|nr:hypothetical protein [Actinomadura alba]MBC6469163.1 hypothetical protein [Actinomadura alba]
MPRIIARRPDGTVLAAVGHAGLIVRPNALLPIMREHMRISLVHSLMARPGWKPVDGPVPDGLLAEVHIQAMREFDRHQRETVAPYERELFESARPDTGDD